MSQYWKLGFPNFPFFEVRILLLRNIIAAKPMVRFGFPKHQKVYRGHKMVPCEFCTQPQATRNLPQLAQPTSNKKWKPLAPHQRLKKSKNGFFSYNQNLKKSINVFWFFSYNFRPLIIFSRDSRLYKRVCPSVRRSVLRSLRRKREFQKMYNKKKI